MNIYYSLSFAYFHMQNNFLPIIYFCSMRNWPSSTIFDKFSTSTFSKTKRHVNKFYSILSTRFFMQNHPIADCNIVAATPCMYELSKSCVCRLFLSVSFTTFVFSAPLYTTMYEWISAAYFGQLNGQHDIRRLLVLQPAFLSIYGYRGGGRGWTPFYYNETFLVFKRLHFPVVSYILLEGPKLFPTIEISSLFTIFIT